MKRQANVPYEGGKKRFKAFSDVQEVRAI